MDIGEISSGRTERVLVDPDELRPSVEDVTRCAAGPDYEPRDAIRSAIERMLAGSVLGHIQPVYCFAIYPVTGPGPGGLQLGAGPDVELALPAGQAPPAALAAAVCTVGEVDERLEGLIESQGPLDAWIGQGIALAQLEILERLCTSHILRLAESAGARTEDYVEPEVGTRSQQDLFAVLDRKLVPVRLTQYGTMQPRMSYSFWLPLRPG